MKICAVIGANGFVGSYLVDRIAQKEDVWVRAFDRYSKDPQFIKRDNIEVVKGDMFSDSDLHSLVVGADYVIYSFSSTTPFLSDSDPYIDIKENLMRSVRLFEYCAKEGVSKVVFISSGGAIYGSVTEYHVATELDTPHPVSPYGINKLSTEHYLEYFKRKFGTEYVTYRLTNPYGPRQVLKHNQGVVPAFIDKIKKGEELVVYGDGTSSRDYIYMDDAARMIADTFDRDNEWPVYNIGSGQQTSVNDIIDALAKASKKKPKVEYKEPPKTFLAHSSVSIDRFLGEFGDYRLMPLAEGLKRTFHSHDD